MLNEDAAAQPRSNDRNRDNDRSPSEPDTSQDQSKSSDATDAATHTPRASVSQTENGTPTNAAESGLAGPIPSETLLGLLPSLPSMDMFFNSIDTKLSTERVSAGGDEGVRSNVAVQELLRTWEEEQHPYDLTVQAQDPWQVCSCCASHL